MMVLETLMNSFTETLMLLINLILCNGMYAHNNVNFKAFYIPKLATCIGLFLSMWSW